MSCYGNQDSHKLTPPYEVSPLTSICQKARDAWELLMTTALLPHLAFTLRYHCHFLPVNLTWPKHLQWWEGARGSGNTRGENRPVPLALLA